MEFEDLKNPELQEKLKAAETAEELIGLAASKGIDLNNEQLQAISGGSDWSLCDDNECQKFGGGFR